MAKITKNEFIQESSSTQKVDIKTSFTDDLKNKLQSESVDYRVIVEKRIFDDEGFQELIERLVTVFIEDTPKELLELRQAIVNSDPFAKNKAYSLKLTCESLGAKKMVRILDLIEQGRTSHHNTLLLIDGLEDEFFNVYNELIPFSSWNYLINSDT